MAYQYGDFESLTGTARLDRLRLHLAEVRADMGTAISADNRSEDPGGLVQYIKDLQARLTELEGRNVRAGGMSKIRIG